MASNPNYKKPPVVETVIGVQFPELEGFHAGHFGLYWETLGNRYPKVTDQPRLDPNSETFPRLPMPPAPRLQFVQRLPPNRVWLTAKSDAELIQAQPDRFLFNWRRRKGEPYPSYDVNSKKFLQEFEGFRRFCKKHDLSEPKPELCEVTYINHIMPTEGEAAIELAGNLFKGLRWETVGGFLPTPEGLTFNRAFVIDVQGKPIGRLYAEASIAVLLESAKRSEFVRFSLTARVNHDADGGQELAASLQRAHDWVVGGFADLTDKRIQKDRWELQA